jgi:FlaA1/EpsC-like NDP-sugar epimerase
MRRRLRSPAFPLHRHSLPQMLVDGALLALAYWLAFQLRFDGGPHGGYLHLRERTIWWVLAGGVLILALARVYQRSWSYSTQRDYEAILGGVVAIALLAVVAVGVVRPVQIPIAHHLGTDALRLPNGVVAMFFLLALVLLVGVRVFARTRHEGRPLWALGGVREGRRGVLIVGAGDGGRLVLREITRNPQLRLAPVGFLDDDPRKRGLRIDGVKVRGDTQRDLPRILDEAEPDEVIIAIPSAPGSTRARVVRECRSRAIPVRTLPTVFELLRDSDADPGRSGAEDVGGRADGGTRADGGRSDGGRGDGGARSVPRSFARQVREVRVEDVLGREPVVMELDRVGAYLRGETVLVTGAGGSIGSELCRQIARVAPARLILLDHAEDNLFEIQRELLDDRHVPPALIAAVLADCKEGERMREVFAELRPSVVFHAAAYKHVGLMEANPVEAVRNNAIATRVVAHVAGENGVARFVLVSTDKAVAPATVMGASKALAEFALEAATVRFAQTAYTAVRFGNVLGSSGSVVPIFRRQIARGGPITVTDERMTRYFMTIPEAVQLIIRAGALHELPAASQMVAADTAAAQMATADTAAAQMATADTAAGQTGGMAQAAGVARPQRVAHLASAPSVFVLDMGEPVRIVDLARAMIELSGLDPTRDIAIEIVGRRPGEKLHEELFNEYERRRPTAAEKILLAEREPLAPEAVEAMFEEINLLVLEGDAAGLAAKVAELSAARVPVGQAGVAPSVAQAAAGGSGAQQASIEGDAQAAPDVHTAGDAQAPAPLVQSPGS